MVLHLIQSRLSKSLNKRENRKAHIEKPLKNQPLEKTAITNKKALTSNQRRKAKERSDREDEEEGLQKAMGDYVYKFWHLLDETLNAILFLYDFKKTSFKLDVINSDKPSAVLRMILPV